MGTSGKQNWIAGVGVITLLQIIAYFMNQSLFVCGPALTGFLDLPASRIGLFATLTALGSFCIALSSGLLLSYFQPVTLLFFVLAGSAVALALTLLGHTGFVFLGALLLGLAYGPNVPSGSRLLSEITPEAKHGIVFSIKQAGVPIGAAAAGIILAPLADLYGYKVAIACALLTGLVMLLLVFPTRKLLKSTQQPPKLPGRFRIRQVFTPLLMALRDHNLRTLALIMIGLITGQSIILFLLIPYLVVVLHFSLSMAGIIFGILQAAAVFGRIACGIIADKSRNPTRNMSAYTFTSALCTLGFALLPPNPSYYLVIPLAVAAGLTLAGWNGVFFSEVARLAPDGKVAEATAGEISLLYLLMAATPAFCDFFISFFHSWRLMFYLATLLLIIVGLWSLWRLRPKSPEHARLIGYRW